MRDAQKRPFFEGFQGIVSGFGLIQIVTWHFANKRHFLTFAGIVSGSRNDGFGHFQFRLFFGPFHDYIRLKKWAFWFM